ncbi:MAG: hypothetical protein KF872_12190 [Chitinophagales bacterium]|nr:hypothetical protein [Chitinophagales bacterium]
MSAAKAKSLTKENNTSFKFELSIPLKWLVWGIYSLLILYTTSNHEPWRDEAQSWLIARDLSLSELLGYLPNEGHPPLWYFILMPFAKLGMPYSYIGILHNVIAIAFAWVLLFKNKLNPLVAITLLFSYYFAYEYAVIARNYAMVALLLAILGACYEKRFEQPFLFAGIVFLLFQTNVLAFCAGAAIGVIFFLEVVLKKDFKPKNFVAMAIMAAGGLFTLVLLLSAGLKNGITKSAEQPATALLDAFGNALLLNKEEGSLALFLYLVMALSFIRKPFALLFLAISVLGFSYLIAYKFQGTLRHHGFLLVFLLGAFIIASYYKSIASLETYKWLDWVGAGLFAFVMFSQDLKSIDYIQEENNRNFSDAQNTGEFLMKNGLDKYTIVGHRSYAASAVAPYLPKGKPIWYADQQRNGTFIPLDTVFFNNYMKYNGDYAPYIVAMKFQQKDSILLLMNTPIQYPEFQREWRLIYQTREEPIKRDEVFFIYQHVSI